MNLPNYLTLFRIFLIPVFVIAFYLPVSGNHYIAAFIFTIAAVTDWLDGYLARSLNQTTRLGAFLDPVADKLIVTTALVLIVAEREMPWIAIPCAVIVGRELVISALREWMAEIGKRTSVAVSYIGKFKTVIQMVAVILLLAYDPDDQVLAWLGYILIHIASIMTLWSMVMYLKAAWPEIRHIY